MNVPLNGGKSFYSEWATVIVVYHFKALILLQTMPQTVFQSVVTNKT